MEKIIPLFVGQRAIRLDQVTVNLVHAAVGDAEEPPVGGQRDRDGPLQIGVDQPFFALGIDEPELVSLRLVGGPAGHVKVAVGSDGQAMSMDTLGDRAPVPAWSAS